MLNNIINEKLKNRCQRTQNGKELHGRGVVLVCHKNGHRSGMQHCGQDATLDTSVPCHTIWIQIPALLLIPVNTHSGRQQMMVQGLGCLPSIWGTQTESKLLALAWPSLGCHGHLKNESGDTRTLSQRSLSPHTSPFVFQVNK